MSIKIVSLFSLMISQNTINAIFSAARVEEVIGDFVQLKKSGSNYKALSPFSDEKTPSFMVSPSKQIWKDFSSGKGGNVVSFLMEIEQFSYPEALRYLAQKYHIEIEEDRKENSEEWKEEKKHRDVLFKIQEIANDFFQEQLWESEEGKNIGLSYFKERGFREDIIKKFQLGYSPIQKDAFTQFALNKGYSEKLLEESGLTVVRENYKADRFRERVMFPIFSYSGRVLGFGGRILKNEKKTAKYLNSPETEIYHKSKILYGLFQAKQTIIKKDVCYLVEGYTDVISMFQSGIENVVSSSGTALTPDQIKLVKRLTPNITLLFDGDPAGIKASLRSIDLILAEGMNVRIALFPEGHDPDSFAKAHSQEEVEAFLQKESKDFIDFKADLLMAEAGEDPVKKAEVIKEVTKSIAEISDVIQREIYIQVLSQKMDISESALARDIENLRQGKARKERKSQSEEKKELKVLAPEEKIEVDPIFEAENKLIEIMLKYGDTILEFPTDEETIEITVIEEVIHQLEVDELEFQTELFRKIMEEIKAGFEQDELRIAQHFIAHEDEDLTQFIADALFEKYEVSSNWMARNIFVKPFEKDIPKEVEQTVLNYKLLNVEFQIRNVDNEALNEENRELTLKRTMKLNEVRAHLRTMLSRPI